MYRAVPPNASLKSGAADYALKTHLDQLVPAVRRALRDADLQQAQRQAEENLRASEERYRLLFSSGYDAVFVHEGPDAQGRLGKFIEVNDIACQRLGYTREELLQMTPFDLDAPEDARTIPEITKRLQQNRHATWETVHVAKDGRQFPVEISSRLFELNGKPACLSTIRDITERTRAEEALQQNEADLAEARWLAKCGNWCWDIPRDRVTWSDELYQILGVKKRTTALTYNSFLERVDPADQEAVRQSGRKARTEGKPFEIVYGITTPEGEKRVIRELGYAVRDEAGTVVRLVGTAQDITAQQEAEAELRWKTASLEARVKSHCGSAIS